MFLAAYQPLDAIFSIITYSPHERFALRWHSRIFQRPMLHCEMARIDLE